MQVNGITDLTFAGDVVYGEVDGTALLLDVLAVHVPVGARHSFRVTSATPLEAVQFYTPAGPEQRFRNSP